ncbi:hypothetical protein [Robbsia andropogonis]|nr:hypothetical protein [Robbsia andropogonis]
MRAPKSPPALTPDNVVALLVPGRAYMASAIALKFGRSMQEALPVIDGLVAERRLLSTYDRKHMRMTYHVPVATRPNVTPGQLVPTPSRSAWGCRELLF